MAPNSFSTNKEQLKYTSPLHTNLSPPPLCLLQVSPEAKCWALLVSSQHPARTTEHLWCCVLGAGWADLIQEPLRPLACKLPPSQQGPSQAGLSQQTGCRGPEAGSPLGPPVHLGQPQRGLPLEPSGTTLPLQGPPRHCPRQVTRCFHFTFPESLAVRTVWRVPHDRKVLVTWEHRGPRHCPMASLGSTEVCSLLPRCASTPSPALELMNPCVELLFK